MKPESKKAVVVISSFVALGCVIAYVIHRHKKNKKAAEEGMVTVAETSSNPEINPKPSSTSSSAAPASTYVAPAQTSSAPASTGSGMPSTPTEVMKFQDWMDSKGLKWVNATNNSLNNGSALKKGGGYGNFGPSTQKAWAVYGAEYMRLNAPKIVGSGFRPNDKLIPRLIFDNAYNYPSADPKKVVGKIIKKGNAPMAVMLADSNVKGWIKARAVVEGYTFNPATKAYDSSVKEVYLKAANYTK